MNTANLSAMHPLSENKIKLLSLLVATAFFIEQLDSTIAVTAIDKIASSLNVNSTNITMAIALYLMMLAIFLPVGGWLARKLGCKSIFILAITLFLLGSFGCGNSTNLLFFTLSEIIQGIGGALMVPTGRLFVLQNCNKKQIPKIISMLIWPGLIAPVIGPSLGAYITSYYSWHWLFYINIPIGFTLLSLVMWFFPKTSLKDLNPIKFDWKGFSLLTFALLSALSYLNLISYGSITNIFAYLFLTISIFSIYHFARFVRKYKSPILSLDVWFDDLNLRMTFIAGSIFRISIAGLPILIPLFLQQSLKLTIIQSGNIVLIMFAGNLMMKPLTTYIMRKIGFKNTLISGSIITSATLFICGLSHSNLITIAIALFFNGAFRSLQFSAYNTLVFSEIPKPKLNQANVLNGLFNQLSFAVGVALISVLLKLGENTLNTTLNLSNYEMVFYGLACVALLPLAFLNIISKNYGHAIL